jgi:hypothetical protein
MQRKVWTRVLARTAGTFVLCAVPALALASFSPRALSALAGSSPRTAAAPAVSGPSAGAVEANLLRGWVDTATSQAATIDTFLLNQGKSTSASLGKQVSALAAQLKTLTPNSPQFNLVLQQFQLISAEQQAWNASYKKFFVKGSSSDLTRLQNSILSLQLQFMNAQTNQTVSQSTAIQTTGSASAFTPPNFTF